MTFKAEFGAFWSQLGPPELILAFWLWPFGSQKITQSFYCPFGNHFEKPFWPFGTGNHVHLLEAIFTFWLPSWPFGSHLGRLVAFLAFRKLLWPFGASFQLSEAFFWSPGANWLFVTILTF